MLEAVDDALDVGVMKLEVLDEPPEVDDEDSDVEDWLELVVVRLEAVEGPVDVSGKLLELVVEMPEVVDGLLEIPDELFAEDELLDSTDDVVEVIDELSPLAELVAALDDTEALVSVLLRLLLNCEVVVRVVSEPEDVCVEVTVVGQGVPVVIVSVMRVDVVVVVVCIVLAMMFLGYREAAILPNQATGENLV